MNDPPQAKMSAPEATDEAPEADEPEARATGGGNEKFDFRLEDWTFEEVSGHMISTVKIGTMQVHMTADATKSGGGNGPATATVTLEKKDGQYSPTAFAIDFQDDGLSCLGRPGQKGHDLDVDVASTDPFRGELSGEIACSPRGSDDETWVTVSGQFDEEGL